MKKFFNWPLLGFLLIAVIVFIGISSLTIWDRLSATDAPIQLEKELTLWRLHRCEENTQATKLILGDSVADQIFGNLTSKERVGAAPGQINGDLLCLAHNACVTMAGQYVYARQFLETRADKSKPCAIYLVLSPGSATAPFACPWNYVDTMAPLGETCRLDWLDEPTRAYLGELFGKPLVAETPVRILECLPLWRYCYLQWWVAGRDGCKAGFDLAERWLPTLDRMCAQHGAELHFLASPLADIPQRHQQVQELYMHLKKLNEPLRSRLLEEYQSSLAFMDLACFGAREPHLTDDRINREYVSALIDSLYCKSGLPQALGIKATAKLPDRLIREYE